MKHLTPFAATLVLLLSPLLAFAQDDTETLIKGELDSGFLFAPELKLTEVNDDFALLAGGYGGWVINRRFLIGGGAYTLANNSSDAEMTYGGGVIEYFANESSLVNVSVRALIGGGEATIRFPFSDFGFADDFLDDLDLSRFDIPNVPGFSQNLIRGIFDQLRGRFGRRDFPAFTSVREEFFVAEPELNVILNISERVRFSAGGGYRFIGGADLLRERLEGFTADLAVKFTFF